VQADLVPEADYFTKLNTELAGGSGSHDVFMTGAYLIWTYGQPGWMEDLNPWLSNSAATSAEYDFEDIKGIVVGVAEECPRRTSR
jgi:multiple sugar transport system substrate-binding protein